MPPLAVLVMDNNPFYLRLANRFLQQRDDVVVLEGDMHRIADWQAGRSILPDIIFLNLDRDTRVGIEFIRRIRSLAPATQLVVLASIEQKSQTHLIKEAGASDVIIRPRVAVEALPLIWQTVSRRRLQQMISRTF
ncbi:MAG: response regulator [Anaerolineales bacterium]|nr:response regulator [Anaerolineales bacterium]